jgi:uncharacterized DUF497 family protein
MEFEYDPAKDEANRFKHGLPLAFAERIFGSEHHVIIASHRSIDGEDRFKAMAPIDGRLFTAVHVWRGEVVRLISVRRSNPGERRDYDSYAG